MHPLPEPRPAIRPLRGQLAAARVAIALLVVAGAMVIWQLALSDVDVLQVTDLGLASVLPASWYVAVGLLAAVFFNALFASRPNPLVMSVSLAAVILVLYGSTHFVEQEPHFLVTYRHAGIADFILHTGTVDPTLDAYFSWPGFFILSAFILRITGEASLLNFSDWAPVVLNALYVLCVLSIAKSLTGNTRVAWLAAWLFVVADWIGQDYYSPQGFNLFLYLAAVAIVLRAFHVASSASSGRPNLRWLPVGAIRRRAVALLETDAGDAQLAALSRNVRVALLAALVVLLAVSNASHQLTPFAFVAAFFALVLFERISLRGLPLIAVAVSAAWISFFAVGYWSGHLSDIVGGLGSLGSNVGQNVSGRIAGSPEHLLVLRMRILMTVAIWLLAGLGVIRRLRRGRADATLTLLAVAPFPLVAAQPYGGEMMLRVYLFALAPMAVLAALLYFPDVTQPVKVWNAGAAIISSLLLFAGFLFARYGNERVDYYTPDETAGIAAMYNLAPDGSLLYQVSAAPAQYKDYTKFQFMDIPNVVQDLQNDDAAAVVASMQQLAPASGAPSYLLVTRSQKAQVDMFSGLSAGSLDRLQIALERAPGLETVFKNGDTELFELAPTSGGSA
ncbi:MAG: hypothetical protein JO247_17670 [Chloroflexi bacterium]|nr:hypothetical protein [Chloroflexota bacterium]